MFLYINYEHAEEDKGCVSSFIIVSNCFIL